MPRGYFHSKNYGGVRSGAGRPKIGQSRALRVNLPEEDWAHIDKLIADGRVSTYSEYFRLLHDSSLKDVLFVEAKQ